MNTGQGVEVLRDIEWVQGGVGVTESYCPSCHWAKSVGHARDCKLAALLDEALKELRPRKMRGELDALAERVLGEIQAIVGERGKRPCPARDYGRALEAVGRAAQAMVRVYDGGGWLSQTMRELREALEVMDKARLRFLKPG